MTAPEEISAETATALRRYLEIQREEQRLKQEKAALQERLAAFMAAQRRSVWFPELDGQRLKVRCQESTVIEYDETLLRERLGARYAAILAPDIRKLRRELPRVEGLLATAMDLVGSPSPERVRAAIEGGQVRKEEFAGAFARTLRRVVAVARARPEDAVGEDGERGAAAR